MTLQGSTLRPNGSAAHPGRGAGLVAGGATNWDDEDPLPRRLSAREAAAFRDQRSAPSPWRVVLVQVEAGAVLALLIGLLFGMPACWSAAYGAATVILPGALMARGATRLADSKSPMATAANLLGWTAAKLVCTVAMLAAAGKILHPIVWPALLAALAGCLTVYWVALARRAR
ncbi:MAG: ATP synthase subunit I [Burkholderiaceae bacterium]